MLFGIVIAALSILGIIGFFSGNFLFVLIAGIISIIENLIGVFSGMQKSRATAIIASIIGGVYATWNGIPIWFGILIGLTFESAIMEVYGLVFTIIMLKKIN